MIYRRGRGVEDAASYIFCFLCIDSKIFFVFFAGI